MTLLHGNMGTESHREDGFPIEARRFKVARKDSNASDVPKIAFSPAVYLDRA